MKKKTAIGVAVASAMTVACITGYKRLEKMEMTERCKKCSEKFVSAISKIHKGLPDPIVDEVDKKAATENFTRQYVSKAPEKARWKLGYSQKSIVPEDLDSKKYCIAGNTRFPANYVAGVLDDIRVRTICVDDSTGRGAVVLCCVDCIGLSNKNIRKIREMLSEFSVENNISYINISSTHTHSSVDTMGIWGELLTVLPNNRKHLKKGEGELLDSCDNDYMQFLFERVCESVKEACCSMKEGKLYESYMGKNSMQALSDDDSLKDRGLYGYVWDRREPYDCSTQLLRLRFVPDDKTEKETVLLNFGAHPYIVSMKERGKGDGNLISGDFVYYLGDYFEKNNYNFIFFNGAVAAVYPTRLYSNRVDLKTQAKAVGDEIGRISLAMTMTDEEIRKNPAVNPETYEIQSGIFSNAQVSQYSKWVEKKGNQVIGEKELKPLLNLSLKKVPLKVDNPIFYMVAKYRVGSYTILPKSSDEYESFTETGLLELGGKRKIAFVPGEMEPAVLSGSQAVKAEESFLKKNFSSASLSDSADDEEMTVFGLTNDAIGYIIPDNDFSMMFLGTGKLMKKLFGNHYLEIFSFGKNTAVSLADTFKSICDEIKMLDVENK